MPFEDEDNESLQAPKFSLKKKFVEAGNNGEELKSSSEKKQIFEKEVNKINAKLNDYKSRAAELANSYKKIISDKTLPQNKNIFQQDIEKDVLSKMISLAVEINNDENEQEGMGTLSWITLLLKYSIHHRDRMNSLEYSIFQMQKQNEELSKKIQSLTEQIDFKNKSE